ncbi:MAG: AmmeMemoRadiSam system protein B [Candidatus Omnitrophica bacterium]|nr:AmmeMemoRadiSam system protein B [Candidatus Omnitrophota bacterium]
MNVRYPCVSGQFYEEDWKRLREQVKACLPKETQQRRDAKGLVVPHAGLVYSGKVAGEVYASISWPKTVVLLGPNHTGEGRPMSLSTAEKWRTPLGDVEVDRELADSLLRQTPELEEDDEAHHFEHSLEVQLPFLQILAPQTKIVPIAVGFGTPEQYKAFGQHLARGIEASQKEVTVIASSDMTHYESHEAATQKDLYAIQSILAVDPDELTRRVDERRISMCGYAPTLAMLSYLRKRNGAKGELLRYQTSGDVTGDRSSVVGYAGILIR